MNKPGINFDNLRTLKRGEKRRVSFTLKPDQMTVIDDNGKSVIEAGALTI